MVTLSKALKQLQAEKPAYQADGGFPGWWYEVIKRTAIGAGGDPQGLSCKLFGFLRNPGPLRYHICKSPLRALGHVLTLLYLVVSTSLPEIVPRLLTRFSSSEGYKLFDDTLPVRM